MQIRTDSSSEGASCIELWPIKGKSQILVQRHLRQPCFGGQSLGCIQTLLQALQRPSPSHDRVPGPLAAAPAAPVLLGLLLMLLLGLLLWPLRGLLLDLSLS